jgi:APA family basic amino acid/polyamine antiporter
MPPVSGTKADQALVRAIGVRGLTASIVNTTIGAGIFVLPALMARDLGAAAPLAYLACGLIMMLVVASFAVAGSRVSLTGGLYAYVETAFGPLIGFVTGVLIWLACLLAAASVASALAASVGVVVPGAGDRIGKMLLLGGIYGAFAIVNVRGVALGTRLIEVVTFCKLLPLVFLVAAAFMSIRPSDVTIAWASSNQIGTSALTLIFAFVGLEVALVPSGEIRDPARTVPRALFLGIGLATFVYLAVQVSAFAVLGTDLARFADAPLAQVAERVLGPWGRNLMLLGAGISMLGFLSGDVLGTSRTLFAFSRDGLLPSALATVHPRFHTPWIAILTHVALVMIAASIGSFGDLVLISNVALLSAYLFCCLSAIVLKYRGVQTGGTPFDLPGGPVIPLAACGVLLWLLSHGSAKEFQVTGVTVAVAVSLYALRAARRHLSRRRVALGDVV